MSGPLLGPLSACVPQQARGDARAHTRSQTGPRAAAARPCPARGPVCAGTAAPRAAGAPRSAGRVCARTREGVAARARGGLPRPLVTFTASERPLRGPGRGAQPAARPAPPRPLAPALGTARTAVTQTPPPPAPRAAATHLRGAPGGAGARRGGAAAGGAPGPAHRGRVRAARDAEAAAAGAPRSAGLPPAPAAPRARGRSLHPRSRPPRLQSPRPARSPPLVLLLSPSSPPHLLPRTHTHKELGGEDAGPGGEAGSGNESGTGGAERWGEGLGEARGRGAQRRDPGRQADAEGRVHVGPAGTGSEGSQPVGPATPQQCVGLGLAPRVGTSEDS